LYSHRLRNFIGVGPLSCGQGIELKIFEQFVVVVVVGFSVGVGVRAGVGVGVEIGVIGR
jgi:hypothetical protein